MEEIITRRFKMYPVKQVFFLTRPVAASDDSFPPEVRKEARKEIVEDQRAADHEIILNEKDLAVNPAAEISFTAQRRLKVALWIAGIDRRWVEQEARQLRRFVPSATRPNDRELAMKGF